MEIINNLNTWFSNTQWLLLLTLVVTFGSASAGKTTLVSVDSNGIQRNNLIYNGGGEQSKSSANGRYVVFVNEHNLVVNDTNSIPDIYVRDRLTNTTTRVSVASNGTQANGVSLSPDISADGRYVVFRSSASNLVANDTNGTTDIFVHDRITHQTSRVSISSTGAQSTGASSSPSISADGRYVAFSSAGVLVAAGSAAQYSVYVHDRTTHKTTLASVASNGTPAVFVNTSTSISADGRYVAFQSNADNLIPNDTNGFFSDVFVHDNQTNQTIIASVNSAGVQFGHSSGDPIISLNGRYVAFIGHTDLLGIPGFLNQVIVRDLKTHTTRLVSTNNNGQPANNSDFLWLGGISADGRFVTFSSLATNLVVNDNNSREDVYVHDNQKHSTMLISQNANGGSGDDQSIAPGISADGRFVSFLSWSDTLVNKDINNSIDIFMSDRLLNNTLRANLKVTATQFPVRLLHNTVGTYVFTVTNLGSNAVANVSLQHVVYEGTASAFAPAGKCIKYGTTLALCNMGPLASGSSMIFTVNAKAGSKPGTRMKQEISVNGEPVDTVPTNNVINVSTAIN